MATSSQIPLPGLTISPSSTPNLSSPPKPTTISFPPLCPPNPNFLNLKTPPNHHHHISPLRAHRHTPKTTPRNKSFTRQRKMPDEKDQYHEDETPPAAIMEKTESKPRKKGTPALLGMKQKWVAEGVVTESLSNGMYRICLGDEHVIIGYVSGKIRTKSIRILPGDRVRVEMSSYDLTKGRIVYRL